MVKQPKLTFNDLGPLSPLFILFGQETCTGLGWILFELYLKGLSTVFLTL